MIGFYCEYSGADRKVTSYLGGKKCVRELKCLFFPIRFVSAFAELECHLSFLLLCKLVGFFLFCVCLFRIEPFQFLF